MVNYWRWWWFICIKNWVSDISELLERGLNTSKYQHCFWTPLIEEFRMLQLEQYIRDSFVRHYLKLFETYIHIYIYTYTFEWWWHYRFVEYSNRHALGVDLCNSRGWPHLRVQEAIRTEWLPHQHAWRSTSIWRTLGGWVCWKGGQERLWDLLYSCYQSSDGDGDGGDDDDDGGGGGEEIEGVEG